MNPREPVSIATFMKATSSVPSAIPDFTHNASVEKILWHVSQLLQMFIHLLSVAGWWPNLVMTCHCSHGYGTEYWVSPVVIFLLLFGVMTTKCWQGTHGPSLVSVVMEYSEYLFTKQKWCEQPQLPAPHFFPLSLLSWNDSLGQEPEIAEPGLLHTMLSRANRTAIWPLKWQA